MPHSRIQNPPIVLVAAIILVIVSVLVGISVFMVMQRHAERLLDYSLQSSLQSRVQLTEAEIRSGFGRTTVAVTRPRLIDLVERLNADAGDDTAHTILQEVAQSFIPTGLTAIAIFNKDGRELGHAGAFIQKSALSVSLMLPGKVELMWDGQLWLHVVAEMKQENQLVGKIVTETPLTATTRAFKDASRLGKTGELVLCAPFGLTIQCFPSTLNPHVMSISRAAADGKLQPMNSALAGETGFESSQDYRKEEVKAAYAPVGDLGLGMVLKVDSADLYGTVWRQLRYLIPLLLAMLIIAVLALRWLLAPLVLRLVRSEARIAGLNLELEQRVANRTAQLEASNRDLEEFAYSVAHDLRQPLIAIGGFIGLFKRTVQDDRGRHYIARINAGIKQADELTDALLTLANLSRVQLQVQSVDLSGIAQSVMDALQLEDPGRLSSVAIQGDRGCQKLCV
jgi:hypothetical protein